MKFEVDGLTIYFPYEYIYPEQFQYMRSLKQTLDAGGHCLLEMPTGTGKTIALLSFITSYQLMHPEVGKLVYCTRTVPEMEKVLVELQELIEYRKRYFDVDASPQIFALGLSSRTNLCIHPAVMEEGSRESVDAKCRQLTAPWVREEYASQVSDLDAMDIEDLHICQFYENYDKVEDDIMLPPNVYTLNDLKMYGKAHGLCPYFLARRMVAFANVIVFNYQYMIDPKVSEVVSDKLEKQCVVVFDEAHNIDNIAIEALSVNIRQQTLHMASQNINQLYKKIDQSKARDASRLREEYDRLVNGLRLQGVENLDVLASPVVPDAILKEAVPGNIRRAEHFLAFLKRLLAYLSTRMDVEQVEIEGPPSFLRHAHNTVAIEGKTLRFCYDRLQSLMRTLEVDNIDEFLPIRLICDFGTLIGTYTQGFQIIIEPFDDRMPNIPDPVIQLACLDASIAMKPIFNRYFSVIITSGTLSPVDLYPKILDFHPVVIESLRMTLTRECLCPLVVTRGSDQMPVSTKFDMRYDISVMRNYGRMLVELCQVVPDGVVCFFVSYEYMDQIVSKWNDLGILREITRHKLIFIETQDVAETTLSLSNYRRACDCGRGAVFFSIARGKVAEGIDFDRQYGRCVVMFGIPYQYTLSRILRARLEYLRQTFSIRETDYLNFDAIRQAAQCVGRVIRSKGDYGMMVFADKRYQRADKRSKLPGWIGEYLRESHLNLSTDMLVQITRVFMRNMAQPYSKSEVGQSLMTEQQLNDLQRNA